MSYKQFNLSVLIFLTLQENIRVHKAHLFHYVYKNKNMVMTEAACDSLKVK